MTSQVSIRVATSADFATILALEQSAATAAHWSLEQYRTALFMPGRFAFVLEGNSVVLGFLVARAVDKEWELENIVVTGSAQRRGLGTELLNELLSLARTRHGESIFLEVRESNLSARSFYERRGFLECGRRRNYYGAPQEDAIVYRLRLG